MRHDNRTQLSIGARVRNWTQEYDAARSNGTANIVEVLKQHPIDQTWEYLVRTDAGQLLQWNMVDVPTRPTGAPAT
ncbi:hypothetical protein [Mycolicibacterium llatzerense]|uniref:hypothetical protein n=1 Tax=Mycolicibacterium llatzerense TaxID=280871 RepID=UPI0008DC9BE4|nr:hypothetical protein [Mycolicibacterium llatzerense]